MVPALCSVSLLFLAALFAFLAYVKPRRRAREQLRRRQQHQHQQQQQQQQQQPVRRPQKLRVSVGLFECMTLSLVATLFFLYVFLIVGKAAQRRLMEGFMPGCIANGLLVQVMIEDRKWIVILGRADKGILDVHCVIKKVRFVRTM